VARTTGQINSPRSETRCWCRPIAGLCKGNKISLRRDASTRRRPPGSLLITSIAPQASQTQPVLLRARHSLQIRFRGRGTLASKLRSSFRQNHAGGELMSRQIRCRTGEEYLFEHAPSNSQDNYIAGIWNTHTPPLPFVSHFRPSSLSLHMKWSMVKL